MIRTEGTDDLQKIADELREAGDKKLARKVGAAIRKAAKPAGQTALRAGAYDMPGRGGLRSKLLESKIGVSAWLRSQRALVEVKLRNPVDLRALDRGILRHPVFADPEKTRKQWTWVRQEVREGAFSGPFERQADKVRGEALEAAQDVLDEVAEAVK